MSSITMKTVLFFTASLAVNTAYSACKMHENMRPGTITVTFPDQSIGAGTVSAIKVDSKRIPLTDSASSNGLIDSDTLLTCDAGESLIWGNSTFTAIPGASSYGYLKTGIDNLYIWAQTSGGSTNPLFFPTVGGGEYIRAVASTNLGRPRWKDIGNMTFVLQRVGPVTQGGIVPAGTLATWRTSDGLHIMDIKLNAFTVNVQGCSVSTKNVAVPMGTVHRSHFKGVGSTAGRGEGNIALQCEAAVAPTVTFSGTRDSETSAEILALNNLGDANVASGVGIQMLYENTPITLDNPIALGKLSGPTAVNIPFTARYYQTASPIKGGDANATAYFTINYE